jgi:arabinose-5-phosphate isomerase
MIKTTALQTINIEIATLENLRASINDDFVAATEAIFANKGRLVITGIGKSAIVAQKIVATLNSTGTPALFMHAADAIHGDLGMIQATDIVLCISKSGDTPEIKVLVPFLKKTGTKLIAMVGNKQSLLSKQADFVLHTPIDKEADPNNLAPTASTTAQMVMGDALATALLALRGFTAEDFAQFHPGGTLGKQLYLRVSDIYPLHERPKVFENTDLQTIIIEMTSKRLGITAVVDDQNHIKGVITDGDLRRMLAKTTDFSNISAIQIMTKNPRTIPHDEMAVQALFVMRKYNITQLIVEKNNGYEGVIHLHDLLKEGLV